MFDDVDLQPFVDALSENFPAFLAIMGFGLAVSLGHYMLGRVKAILAEPAATHDIPLDELDEALEAFVEEKVKSALSPTPAETDAQTVIGIGDDGELIFAEGTSNED